MASALWQTAWAPGLGVLQMEQLETMGEPKRGMGVLYPPCQERLRRKDTTALDFRKLHIYVQAPPTAGSSMAP